MKLLSLLSVAHLILAAPANVKVITHTEIVTVVKGVNGIFTTLDVPPLFTVADTTLVTPSVANIDTATSAPAPTSPATEETTAAPQPTVEPTTEATSTAAPAAPTSTSTSSSSGEFSGDGTYYSTGLGACGITNVDTDYIVAISHELFDQTSTGNPNTNPVCGRKITAFFEGKSVEVTVTDRCEGCALHDLDFSPSAFSQIADQALGRIKITWNWSS